MLNGDIEQKLAQLAQRVWKERKVPERLLNNPSLFLLENGIELPAGLKLRVIADRDSISFQIRPQNVAGGHNEQPPLTSHQATIELILLRYEFKLVWE
jgi:hypothetical protein